MITRKEKCRRNGVKTSHLEQDISIHIFTVSSAMVGFCLTVLGLIRVVITLGTADKLSDGFLAADALLFLVSCLLSTGASLARATQNASSQIADAIFIIAMIGIAVACALITYTIFVPTW